MHNPAKNVWKGTYYLGQPESDMADAVVEPGGGHRGCGLRWMHWTMSPKSNHMTPKMVARLQDCEYMFFVLQTEDTGRDTETVPTGKPTPYHAHDAVSVGI
jgi:hypothetical protein